MTNQQIGWNTIEELCEREFGKLPSPSNLATLKKIEGERAEVRDFIDRIFRLMAVGRFAPKDIPPTMAWAFANIIPGFLPGAWGGLVPPWTFEDRHHLIDAYMAANPWVKFGPGTTLLEIGCGFPPQTAIDTARLFPSWQVIGADPCFDPYVLYDADGNYACLNANGGVRYFHAASNNFATFVALYKDPTYTLQRYRDLFQSLVARLPAQDDGASSSVDHEGARLIRNPMRSYERANLKFVQAGLGAELPQVDIVRCFNVLIYFDTEFRRKAEEWALRTLRPGGLFICGGDAARTSEARYSVYQNDNGKLTPREFAFSIDNIRPLTLNPWFALHDGENEVWKLAKLIGVLRSDNDYRRDYDDCLDALLAEKNIFIRDDGGYFVAPPAQLPPAEWTAVREEINAEMDRRGFVDCAVAILNKAGYQAWRNPVGHVAIAPSGSL